MSEVEARLPPTRGRSTTRGGRGGFSRGGFRGGRKPVNGTSTEAAMEDSFEDQGELGEMKKKYASELSMLKDMFPDWTDVDLVFALQEADGDVAATVDHITQGNVSQFAEVKKPKDRARSKVKDESAMAGAIDKSTTRGGRGRGGFEGVHGGRGRGSDRGRGGFRGGRGGHAVTNGTNKDSTATSVPTTESTAWDTPTNTETANGGWDTTDTDTAKEAVDPGQSSWGNVVTSEATPAAASEGMKSSLIPEGGAKKSWASMFSQPKPAPVPAAAKQAPAASQPPPAELVASGEIPPAQEEAPDAQKQPEPIPPAPSIQEPAVSIAEPSPVVPPSAADGEDLDLTPSKDPLTEANVEHLPDESHAPATQTVASTAGSMDTRNLTPLPNQQQAPIGSRPPMGGYAASAYRATGAPGRSASFQRRVQEQQEAVVMPGHNAVDRATVQFGSMGLNGAPDPDVDEDREEPETQKALPHSPPAQPRTSLPPAPRQAQETTRPEGMRTPKQAPGLPPASQQNQQQMQDATMAPGLSQDQPQMNPSYNQYGRYPGMQQESGAQQQQQQKPYDPFSHQAPNQYDQYGTQQAQAQPQQQQQQPSHAGFGGLSSALNDNYSQYYTSNDQQRNAYNQYYGGSYGQQQDGRSQVGQLQQDTGLGQQRSASGFGAGPNESAYAGQAQQQVSRAPSPPQQTQTAGKGRNEAHADKVLHGQIDRKLMMMTMLPQARSMPSRVLAIHPDLQPEATGLHPSRDFQDSARGTKLAPLEDVKNRLPSAVLCSPLPTVYLKSSNISNKQAQSRFGEAPGSGHNTPNPLMGGQQQSAPNAQQSQMQQGPAGGHQQQPQQGGYGASATFPYGHPYYNSPYQAAYQNQFGGYSQHPQQGGYGSGGGYPAKQGGMYGAQSGYNMGSHSSFDQHSSSPANSGAFGQNQQSSMRSASGMSSGLGGGLEDYGRASVQSGSHQSSAFGGGMNDPFARSASGFGGQGGYGQQSMGGPEDSLKPYNDSKSGPSPALGQPGRPGSAANSAVGSTQSGLPPPQSQQSGFGGYPGFPGQGGSQYGGLGGLGSHQQGQQSGMGGQGGYGQYGAGGFNQTYGGYGSRGGWGSNYGAH